MFDPEELRRSTVTQADREFTKGEGSVIPTWNGRPRTLSRGTAPSHLAVRPPSCSDGNKETEPSLIPLDDSGHSTSWIPIDFGDGDDGGDAPPSRVSQMDTSLRSHEGTTKRRLVRSKSSHDGRPIPPRRSRSDHSSSLVSDGCRSVDGDLRHSSHLSLSGVSVDSFDDYLTDDSFERKAPPPRSVSWGSFRAERKESRFGKRSSSNGLSLTFRRFRFRVMAKLYLFGPAIQTVLVFGFLILVVRSRRSAAIFEEQLRTYNHETSSLLLKLQRIEQNSQSLHKHIGHHMGQAGMDTLDQHDDVPVLSEDLHGKAFELQEAIQEHDYMKIVERFGEGPIKVVFELGLATSSGEASKASTTLDVVLWSDTPHASWTLLDQIERSLWDGAQFHWNPQLASLEILPSHDDPLGRGQLEFAEHISDEQNWHDAWTVGLRQDPDTRRLQLFFNLKDNSDFQAHETCVGRVLGGFDALQTALRSANAREANDGSLPSISVHKAQAKHLTRREIVMASN